MALNHGHKPVGDDDRNQVRALHAQTQARGTPVSQSARP